MTQSAVPAPEDRSRRRRLKWIGLLAVLSCVALALAIVAPNDHDDAPDIGAVLTTEGACDSMTAVPVKMTQANLKSGTPIHKFEKDLAKVYKNGPDFVTFNEVPLRRDGLLAPDGYSLWRTPGAYTGASPVSWRSDKWTAIARGTTVVSNKRGYNPGQHVEWGVRYANWVTLQSLDGCMHQISVVAYHISPMSPLTRDLLKPSVRHLGKLVAFLAPEGPVLLGGDFNRHYRSKLYPRKQLTKFGMVPIWDLSGSYLPTGDHYGATIDFLFLNDARQFVVTKQKTKELYSDHDAVVGEFDWTPGVEIAERPVTFASSDIVNVPTSPLPKGRRVVKRTILRAIRGAASGSAIDVSTATLTDWRITRALKHAYRRGVAVRLTTASGVPTTQEASLMQLIGSKPGDSEARVRARPIDGVSPTVMLFSQTAGVEDLRIDVDRALAAHMSFELSRATMKVGKKAYLAMREKLRKYND